MSITAIVENDTIKLPFHVPDGTKVAITLPGECDEDAVAELERINGFAVLGERAGGRATVEMVRQLCAEEGV